MRAIWAGVTAIVALAAGVFLWQRAQISELRSQMSAQAAQLAANRRNVDDLTVLLAESSRRSRVAPASLRLAAGGPGSAAALDAAASRTEERRLILDQYEDVLSAMALPEAAASRLKDLLADRIEAVLDAEDAARREGFDEGSSEAAQAVSWAVSDLDRQIQLLVGPEGFRRLDGGAPSAPPAPAPAAPVTVVTVVVQPSAASEPAYADAAPYQDTSALAYPGFVYYPAVGYLNPLRLNRPEPRLRVPGIRPREGGRLALR